MALTGVLTVVNIVLTVAGSRFTFAMGLVISQFVAVLGAAIADEARFPPIAWAPGVIAIDSLLLLALLVGAGEMDAIGLGIHLWALWALANGCWMAREAKKAE